MLIFSNKVPITRPKKRKAKVMPTTVEDSAKVVGRFKSSFSSEHELTLFVELEARVTRLERDRELLV